MKDQRVVLREREADSVEQTIPARPSAALSKLLSQCPACGASCAAGASCVACGHVHDRARWRQRRRPRSRALASLIDTPAGNYGVVAFLTLAVAVILLRTGVDRSQLLACAAAFVIITMIPALFLGVRVMARQVVRRQWEYEAPDGAVCVASGTIFQLERAVRIRTLCSGDYTVSDAVDKITPSHAGALATDPIVTSKLPMAGANFTGSVRERAEAVIAAAIAIAKLARDRRVRLVQHSFQRTSEAFGQRESSVASSFGLLAIEHASEESALSRWLLATVPTDASNVGPAYRSIDHASNQPPEKAVDLSAVFARLLRATPNATWAGGELVAVVRAKVAEDGGFRMTAPTVPMDFRQWLAELSGAVWSAMVDAHGRTAGVTA